MSESKWADRLREIKVFNNWILLERFGKSGDVAIVYHHPAEGRLGWSESHHTQVWSPLKHSALPHSKTYGARYGEVKFHGMRAESFPKALAWAQAQFKHKYVPSPFGGYIPEHIRFKARYAWKEAKRNGKLEKAK